MIIYQYYEISFAIKISYLQFLIILDLYKPYDRKKGLYYTPDIFCYHNYMYITALNVKVSNGNMLYKQTFVGFNLWFPLIHVNPMTMKFIYHMIICCINTSVSAWYMFATMKTCINYINNVDSVQSYPWIHTVVPWPLSKYVYLKYYLLRYFSCTLSKQ